MNKTFKTFHELCKGEFFSYCDSEKKNKFHRMGRKVCKEIAAALELPENSFDIRSNKGGVAVSGEITLHGESIYVQISRGCLGSQMDILFRSCKGRKDYTGGANNFASIEELATNTENVICAMRRQAALYA